MNEFRCGIPFGNTLPIFIAKERKKEREREREREREKR